MISVTKLSSSLHHELVFSFAYCMIQDKKSRRKIGSVEAINRLHHLNMIEFVNSSLNFGFATVCNEEDVWHHRLGHLSNTRLNVLNKKFPDMCVSTDFASEVCPKAKQNKLPVNKYVSVTLNAFDLVHIDI